MSLSPQQPELLPAPVPLPGGAMVNHHVCVQTEGINGRSWFMASSFPITPFRTAPRKLTPWCRFSNRDTQIRTILLAASAVPRELCAVTNSVSEQED